MFRRNPNLLALSFAAVAMAAFLANAQAATIEFLGSDETTGISWRTTTLAKLPAFDPNGDNAYGNDGYYVINSGNGAGAPVASSLPSYVGSVNDNGSTFNAPVYPNFDNPALPIGPAVADTDAGIFFKNSAADPFGILDFTLAQNEKFVLTIPLVGDNTAHRPTSLTLEQIVGGSAMDTAIVPAPANGDAVNYLFFLVDGSAGDAFQINIGGSGNIRGIGGVAFEAPVPEPASIAIWSLLGLGLAGLGYCRIKRRK